jgi:low affinity Fe/Cu permease
MSEQKEKSWLEALGCRVSEWVAEVAGHPYAQLGFIIICLIWFIGGWNINILTAALSILAITLTQMVLNNQNEREVEAHRRDVGMHAKLDELIAASRRAKNEFVGIEERAEEEIVQLKEEVKEAIDETPDAADPTTRETAKRAVEKAADELKNSSRKKKSPKTARKAPSRER